ncbi:MAG: ASCH domain-containing protein [Francisellaceae bacterium]
MENNAGKLESSNCTENERLGVETAKMNDSSQQFLNHYLESLPQEHKQRHRQVSSGYFCDDETNANHCVELIRQGIKTATCSLKAAYDIEQEPLPVVGKLHVVTNWQDQPQAIIETTEVRLCRYCDVTAEFAWAEGEEDRSLRSWRELHWAFFSKASQDIGTVADEKMMLVLERFKLVYSSP